MGGDETVPSWSSSLSGAICFQTKEEHGNIYTSHDLLELLARTIDKQYSAAQPSPVQLEITGSYFDTEETVVANLLLRQPRKDRISGHLQFEYLQSKPEADFEVYEQIGERTEISVEAAQGDLERHVEVRMPEQLGAYRLACFQDEVGRVAATDPVFVRVRNE